MRKKQKPRRIVPVRVAGINNKKAAYWKGERAEVITRERVATYPKRKTKKKP